DQKFGWLIPLELYNSAWHSIREPSSHQREIGFLTVHSMLHLLGYDHEAGGLPATRMREKEEDILSALGLTRDVSYVTPE
ncbi:MAG: rRNA maturation RNase YbeY, partial [Angelakisella sp.]